MGHDPWGGSPRRLMRVFVGGTTPFFARGKPSLLAATSSQTTAPDGERLEQNRDLRPLPNRMEKGTLSHGTQVALPKPPPKPLAAKLEYIRSVMQNAILQHGMQHAEMKLVALDNGEGVQTMSATTQKRRLNNLQHILEPALAHLQPILTQQPPFFPPPHHHSRLHTMQYAQTLF